MGVDTAAMDMEASMEDTMASVRPRLSPTSDMVATVLVDTAATAMEDSTWDITASVRLRPNPRLLPSPILDTEDMVDTVLVDTVATAMEVSTGDTMASVRLRPSPTSDMEVMEDTVLVAMEDTVVTVMAMASKIIFCRRNHSIMHKNVAFLMYLQIYNK